MSRSFAPERHQFLCFSVLFSTSLQHDYFLFPSHVTRIQLVVATLEDAVNDAPKAPEFMGQLLANLVVENLISLKEIGKFIYEGGEEAGKLLQVGLAADVLGNVLEVVQLEKGQIFLNEILKCSDLQLETFRPSYPIKSTKLEKFI